MISSFTTPETKFLSNFWPCTIKCMGHTFPSVENAYQAAKCPVEERNEKWNKLLTCSPAAAKKLGRQLPLREDWNEIRVVVMHQLCILKFNDPVLEKMLLNTDGEELIEGNWWNDTFWGVCKGKGQNWLGKILMTIRDQKKIEKIEKKCLT